MREVKTCATDETFLSFSSPTVIMVKADIAGNGQPGALDALYVSHRHLGREVCALLGRVVRGNHLYGEALYGGRRLSVTRGRAVRPGIARRGGERDASLPSHQPPRGEIQSKKNLDLQKSNSERQWWGTRLPL